MPRGDGSRDVIDLMRLVGGGGVSTSISLGVETACSSTPGSALMLSPSLDSILIAALGVRVR